MLGNNESTTVREASCCPAFACKSRICFDKIKLVPFDSRNAHTYKWPALPFLRCLLWSPPKTPNQDGSGAVVDAVEQYVGAGNPTPCHKQFPPQCGTGQRSQQLAVGKVMANGNPISLESLFWEQSGPSKSLVKKTKQTLVQIEPVSFESYHSQLSVSFTACCRRSSPLQPLFAQQGWHRPLQGQGREGWGKGKQAAWQCCPTSCPTAPACLLGPARGLSKSLPLSKMGGGGPAPHSWEAVTMGTQVKATV